MCAAPDCNAKFIAQQGGRYPHVYCSTTCAANANPGRGKNLDRRQAPRQCERPGCEVVYAPGLRAKGKPPQRYCSKSCATTMRNLARSGGESKYWRDGRRLTTRESEYVRTRALAKSRKRRLRLGAKGWDGVTDHEILVRDNWICGICREPINPRLRYPDPDSPSVDHVQALSLGGGDDQWNKRAAHLGCNIARGDGQPDEQMVLPYGPGQFQRQRPRYVPCPVCGEGIGVTATCKRHRPLVWCQDCQRVIPNAPPSQIRCHACRVHAEAEARRAHAEAEARRAAVRRARRCRVPGCGERNILCDGCCPGHYLRLKKYGDVFADIPLAGRGPRPLTKPKVSQLIRDRLAA